MVLVGAYADWKPRLLAQEDLLDLFLIRLSAQGSTLAERMPSSSGR